MREMVNIAKKNKLLAGKVSAYLYSEKKSKDEEGVMLRVDIQTGKKIVDRTKEILGF